MPLLIMGFVLIALIDFIPVIRKKDWGLAAVFLLIFVSALVFSVLEINNIKIPSIMEAAGNLMKSIGLSY